MDVGDIARIVAYILPGYVANVVRSFFVRDKKRDNFDKLASCLLLSLAAYAIGVGIFFLAYRADWSGRISVCRDNWFFILLLFLIAVLIGYGWARLTTWKRLQLRLYKHKVDYTEFPNVWNEVWHSEEKAPWVIAQLKDGSEFFGAVRAYTNDPDEAKRELWLFPVWDGTNPQENQIVNGLSVYIPGDQVKFISVYKPEHRAPANDEP